MHRCSVHKQYRQRYDITCQRDRKPFVLPPSHASSRLAPRDSVSHMRRACESATEFVCAIQIHGVCSCLSVWLCAITEPSTSNVTHTQCLLSSSAPATHADRHKLTHTASYYTKIERPIPYSCRSPLAPFLLIFGTSYASKYYNTRYISIYSTLSCRYP